MAFAESFIQFVDSTKTVLMYTWWLFLLIGIWVNRYRWSKFPLDVVILEKRGDNLVKTNDRAGKFHDKHADMTFYKLKKCGDTIPVYDFNWVLHNVSVPTNILERYINIMQGSTGTIFLFRYGSKQYKPLVIDNDPTQKRKFVPVKDKNGDIVYSDQYVHFDPRNLVGLINFEVIDWDNMNFMVQEQRASLARRINRGNYLKQMVVPLAIVAGSVLFALLLLKYSADAGASLRGYGAEQQVQTNQPESGNEILQGSNVGSAINNIVTPGQ